MSLPSSTEFTEFYRVLPRVTGTLIVCDIFFVASIFIFYGFLVFGWSYRVLLNHTRFNCVTVLGKGLYGLFSCWFLFIMFFEDYVRVNLFLPSFTQV